MKKCIKELIKEISNLEGKKETLLREERNDSKCSYVFGEMKPGTGYDFEDTREAVKDVNDTIVRYKHLINCANCNTKVFEDKDMTIDQALVKLAQLNNELYVVSTMCAVKPYATRVLQSGVTEVTEYHYDIKVAKEYKEALTAEVQRLQIAIDRINLTTMIEI